jgi:uncharacterized membrane protein
MVLAADYPILGAFWTLLMFTGFIIWLILLFNVFGDIFRRHDIGGGMKALWIVLLVVVPYFGVFIYLITQHNSMQERSIQAQQDAKAAFDAYVQQAAGTSKVDEIAKANELLASGAITQDEFNALKAKALS